MAEKIIMPKQGLQMTEGTITKWLVKEGDKVEIGQPLFEMETDKNTIQIDSTAAGEVLKLVAKEDETVPITETIAIVGKKGEDFSDVLPKKKEEKKPEPAPAPAAPAAPAVKSAPAADDTTPIALEGGRIFVTPRAKMTAERKNIDYKTVKGTGPSGLIIEKDVLAAAAVKASPVAKAIAARKGVSITTVTGTGENGKIVKHDILSGDANLSREDKVIPISGMRKVIADNMMNSVQSMAHAYHKVAVDMSEAKLIRAAFKKTEKKVSFNDIIIMALGRALQEHPRMNAWVEDGKITEKGSVNVGIAVAVDNGLIVPTVRDVQNMTIGEIHDESARLIAKTKAGGLKKEEYSGATFTVSNLGMFGIDEFTAIVNPPQVGILAVGSMTDTPVVRDGQIVIRPMMNLVLNPSTTGSSDGAPAAQFLRQSQRAA